ncbi:MAG: Response regulator receiver [Acidimicrobiales bacterium]|jgi:two-component system alkaline phosphatase synthesis response regulator PhoP|nr:Response regulator receiver [Acidimicrobiales bacterium]
MSTGRVLVVDDEDDIRELCRVNLEFEGYEVLDAADGEAALQLARRERPDIIFLDLMMPKMDGWDVLRHLKEDDTTADIPVILLTAKTGENEQMRGWSEGILEYVSKPFNPLSLVEWANRAMQPRNAEDEAERRRRILEQLRLVQELRQNS